MNAFMRSTGHVLLIPNLTPTIPLPLYQKAEQREFPEGEPQSEHGYMETSELEKWGGEESLEINYRVTWVAHWVEHPTLVLAQVMLPGLWDRAPHQTLCRAWSLPGILSLSPALPLLCLKISKQALI